MYVYIYTYIYVYLSHHSLYPKPMHVTPHSVLIYTVKN